MRGVPGATGASGAFKPTGATGIQGQAGKCKKRSTITLTHHTVEIVVVTKCAYINDPDRDRKSL